LPHCSAPKSPLEDKKCIVAPVCWNSKLCGSPFKSFDFEKKSQHIQKDVFFERIHFCGPYRVTTPSVLHLHLIIQGFAVLIGNRPPYRIATPSVHPLHPIFQASVVFERVLFRGDSSLYIAPATSLLGLFSLCSPSFRGLSS
jgi:hypothetical protein